MGKFIAIIEILRNVIFYNLMFILLIEMLFHVLFWKRDSSKIKNINEIRGAWKKYATISIIAFWIGLVIRILMYNYANPFTYVAIVIAFLFWQELKENTRLRNRNSEIFNKFCNTSEQLHKIKHFLRCNTGVPDDVIRELEVNDYFKKKGSEEDEY